MMSVIKYMWTTAAVLAALGIADSSNAFVAVVVPGGKSRATTFAANTERRSTTRDHLASTAATARKNDQIKVSSSSSPSPNQPQQQQQDNTPFPYKTPLSPLQVSRNKQTVSTLKHYLFDILFSGKGIDRAMARFYALETIARMPYFSYLSVLHYYETVGCWRQAHTLAVHFAESYNELHHLLIMEELGGNALWKDRFIAQHVAVAYYWIIVALYFYSPAMAYNLNQAVEQEAYQTYDNFIKTPDIAEYLKSQPAPAAAVQYYTGKDDDLYLFHAMHHDYHHANQERSSVPSQQQNDNDTRRRPVMNTLYDTFVAIRDDEWEHAKTMAFYQQAYCQDDNDKHDDDKIGEKSVLEKSDSSFSDTSSSNTSALHP